MNHKFFIYLSIFLILSLFIGFLPSISQPVDALVADTALVSSVITALSAGVAGTGVVSIIINTLKYSSNTTIQSFRDAFWSEGTIGSGIDYYAVDPDEQQLIISAIESAVDYNEGYHQLNSTQYFTLSYSDMFSSILYDSSNSNHYQMTTTVLTLPNYFRGSYAETVYYTSSWSNDYWTCVNSFPSITMTSKRRTSGTNTVYLDCNSVFHVDRPGTYQYSSGFKLTCVSGSLSYYQTYSKNSAMSVPLGAYVFMPHILQWLGDNPNTGNFIVPKISCIYTPVSGSEYSLLPTGYSTGDGTFTMGDDDGSGIIYTFIDPDGNTWDYYDDYIKLGLGEGNETLGDDPDLLDGKVAGDDGLYTLDYIDYETGDAIDESGESPVDTTPDITWPDADDNTTTPDIDVPTYPDVESEWPQVIDPSTIDDITDIDELPIIDPLNPDDDPPTFSWDGFWEKFYWIKQLNVIITDLTDFETNDSTPNLILHFGNADGSYLQNSGDISALDLSWYADYRPYVNNLLAGILWFFFILNLFRHAPSVFGGGASNGWYTEEAINHPDDLPATRR